MLQIPLKALSVTIVLLLCGISRSQGADQNVQAAAKSSVSGGRTLYESVGCSACHGFGGQGGVASGPKLVPDLLPRVAFVYQLRQPRNAMPPYSSGALSDQDVDRIYQYLSSLSVSRRAAEIPLLDSGLRP